MIWKHIFLFLILVPILLYGHDKDKCTSIHDVALEEWNKHSGLIDQFNKLEENDREGGLPLLFESIECCKKALAQIERILKDIKGKSREKRKIPWRTEFKEQCRFEVENINKEIVNIKSAIHSIQSSSLYRKSADKAAFAETKNRECIRRFNNVVEVVSVLNEVASLYDEAAMTAQEGLGKISSYPQHQHKAALQNAAEVYQGLAAQYKQQAAEWPASIRDQKQALAKRLSTLKEECNLFAEKGLKHRCHESQKQAALILEQLFLTSFPSMGNKINKKGDFFFMQSNFTVSSSKAHLHQ